MPDVPESRALTMFEAVNALNSSTIWLTLRVEGELDLDALRAAWGLLRQAHPVLGAQIRPCATELLLGAPGFDLAPAERPAPAELRMRPAGSAPGLYPLRQRDTLSAVEVSPDGDGAVVSLAVHHSIADGRLGLYWNALLWSYYTDVAEGRAPEFEPAPVPRSPADIFAERGFVRGELGPSRTQLAAPVPLPASWKLAPVHERARLSEQSTTRLRAYAKQVGTTMHGLVAGTVALAVRRGLDLPPGQTAPIALSSPVDFRERLDPAVEIWGGTNVLGFCETVVCAHAGSDPAGLGSEVLAQLHDDLRSGVLPQSYLHAVEAFFLQQPKIPHAITSNLGVVAQFRAPRGVAIDDLRVQVVVDTAPAVALARAAGMDDAPPHLGPTHMVSMYKGRLAVDISLPGSPEDARAHTDRVSDVLLELASRAD